MAADCPKCADHLGKNVVVVKCVDEMDFGFDTKIKRRRYKYICLVCNYEFNP